MKFTNDEDGERITIHCYQDILNAFSKEEMALIVQLKRFFECSQGDRDFREHFLNGTFTEEDRLRLVKIGVLFDLDGLSLAWKDRDAFMKVLEYQATFYKKRELAEDLEKVLESSPLLQLWFRYNTLYAFRYSRYVTRPLSVSSNSKLDRWRMRRVESTKSELGLYGHQIDHPTFAIELGDGCSVGCWFCAFATRKLQSSLDYSTKKDFFKRAIKEIVDLFGESVAGDTLLYYGTEPHDNPHYLDFCRDFREITGYDVCTSTAVTGDAAWIRSLIEHYRERNLPWPRLSVLSKSAMNFVHDNFTPEELRDVELLMQMKERDRAKVPGGRILKEQDGLKTRSEADYLKTIVPPGSIACVSGFLINLVKRTVQVVSPCYTCEKWPFGYRIFDTREFTEEPGDLTNVIKKVIEANMFDHPPADKVLRFRDDFDFRETAEGFDLVSRNQIHHYRGGEFYTMVGKLIAEGRYSPNELFTRLVEEEKLNPMLMQAFIGDLYQDGYISEVYQEPMDA
jgi:radical SAM family RiPP maturation amino acid epimerase